MKQYLELGRDILLNGNTRSDRTETGTRSVFGRQIRFNLADGFPLLTTKKMFLKGIIHELLWFLKGDTNNNTLEKEGVTIWQEWATEDGELGPIYGHQWLYWRGGVKDLEVVTKLGIVSFSYETYNQIAELIENLKKKPFSRRHVVSTWNVPDLPDESISPQDNVKNGKMALAPCHCLFQFYVQDLDLHERGQIAGINTIPFTDYETQPSGIALQRRMDTDGIPKYKLSCQLYQRSADYPLGVPYNIASYALLTMMIAQCVNMVPGEFIHTFGDVHVYSNQIEKFKEQLEREPMALPRMEINPEVKDIFGFRFNDFQLKDYVSHPKIDYPISV